MPIPLSFNRRRLIRPGQPPMGELSQMPEVAPPQPAPIQIPRPEWRPPMAAPEPEPERLPRNWQPPMVTTPHPLEQYADNVQRQTAAAPMQSNASKLGIGLQRPQQIQRPDVPIVGGGGATVADNPYDRANYDYVMEGAKRNPDGTLAGDKIQIKRSGKDIALAALAGLGRGGLVGAATGAIAATIDPKTGRQINFDAFHAPQIQAAMERGQQQDTLQRQRALQDIAMQRGTLGLEQDQTETEILRQKMRDFPEEMKSIRDERAARAKEREARVQSLLNPLPRPRNTYVDGNGFQRDRDTNEVMRDPETGQKIYAQQDKPLSLTDRMREAESELEAGEGTPEEIAETYYTGRGGDNYVMQKLPMPIRQVIGKGTVTEAVTMKDGDGDLIEPDTTGDGKGGMMKNPRAGLPQQKEVERPATPAEVASAKAAFDRAVEDERKAILLETKGNRRKAVSGTVTGSKPTMSRPSGGGGQRGTVGEYHIQALIAADAKDGVTTSREDAIKELKRVGYSVQ